MASYGYDLALVPPGTVVTASGAGNGVEVGNRTIFRGQSIVTAASGTSPSLTVTVETSHDNGATDAWRGVGFAPAYTAQTAVNTSAWKSFSGLDRFVRASWAVSGTSPSITFGVVGEAV
jgi:hypothetical protein